MDFNTDLLYLKAQEIPRGIDDHRIGSGLFSPRILMHSGQN